MGPMTDGEPVVIDGGIDDGALTTPVEFDAALDCFRCG